MTDREILVATFTAVCALAERLTGERMLIEVRTEGDGSPLKVYGDPSTVKWTKALPAVAVALPDPDVELRSTPREEPSTTHANQ